MALKDDIASKILSAIDETDVLSLANALIKIPSFTTEETKCAQFLYKYLKRKDFSVQLQKVEPGRYQTIATLKGRGKGRSLMFNGHIDIDPLSRDWTRDPWKPVVEDGKLYGAGIQNMKGGVTAMIKAAEALKKAKISLKGDLKIACVAGELQGGVGTVHLLKSGIKADMAVVPEPYGAHNIITTHAGVVEFAIHTYGVSKHISMMEQGVNAIDNMYKIIQALKRIKFTHEDFPQLPGIPRMNIGAIIGGHGKSYEMRGVCNVPDICTVLVDARTVPGMSGETIKRDIQIALDELKKDNPTLQYELEFPAKPEWRINRVEMFATELPTDSYIVQSLRRSHQYVEGRDMDNVGVVLPQSYPGNDTSHLWRAHIPCCLYGPRGQMMPESFQPVDQIMTVTKVLALTALDVCT